jgi:two-component system CheB/CheR fusion protein
VETAFRLADRKTLEKYGPPGVVVNDRFEILQFRGRTERFLELPAGAATLNVLRLARPELVGELRRVVQQAFLDHRPVTSDPMQLFHNHASTVVLDVEPLRTVTPGDRSALVLFVEQVWSRGPAASDDPGGDAGGRDDPREPPHDLENDLATTRRQLQTTIAELVSTNEDLQSSNEQLRSSNEELRSSNEELGAAREAVQAANEELVTLNEELLRRMTQLGASNDDLDNILRHVGAAFVLVGMDFAIRRFSSAAGRLLGLTAGDVGRSVGRIRYVLNAHDLEQTIRDVIRDAAPIEQPVRGIDGARHTLRIAPYLTADHAISGATIEVVGASPPTSCGSDAGHELAQAAVAALPQAIMMLDEWVRVVWGNRAFLDLFGVGPEVFGRPLEGVWNGRTEQPRIWALLEGAAVDGRAFQNERVAPATAHPPRSSWRVSAHRLPATESHGALAFVTIDCVGRGGE